MRKTQPKTYQDLLVAVNASVSPRSMDRLLQAEHIARKTLTNKHDAMLNQSLKDTVARLVRWLDEPFTAQVAESLIIAYVRETTPGLSGKRVKDRMDLACPVCGMGFTVSDIKNGELVSRTCFMRYGGFVARYRCGKCESIWEDSYQVNGGKLAGDAVQKVLSDGRF